jgi:hypothetical protein
MLDTQEGRPDAESFGLLTFAVGQGVESLRKFLT